MAELLGAFLEMITPKSKAGKIVWGVLFAVMIALVILELAAAFED